MDDPCATMLGQERRSDTAMAALRIGAATEQRNRPALQEYGDQPEHTLGVVRLDWWDDTQAASRPDRDGTISSYRSIPGPTCKSEFVGHSVCRLRITGHTRCRPSKIGLERDS